MKRLFLASILVFLIAGLGHTASNYGIVTVSSQTVTQVFALDSSRVGMDFINNGSDTMFCGFDVNVSTFSSGSNKPGIPFIPLASWGHQGERAYKGDIYCRAAAGSSGVDVRYWWWSK